MNLWHDISFGSAEKFNVIVEVPAGSFNKYEIDKDTGLIELDRVNYGAAPYPFNYCFVPQTLWEDGDALDVMLLGSHPIHPGILVKCRAIGLMEMIDGGENDSKVIAVPVKDKEWDHVQDLNDLSPHSLRLFEDFFRTYKNLKGAKPEDNIVEVPGFKGKADALAALEKSVALYQEKYPAQ